MYEFTCLACGKTKQVRYAYRIGKFCDHKCAAAYQKGKAWNRGESCVFQPEAVMCSERNCTNCGWNPVVAKARLEAFGRTPEAVAEPKKVPERETGKWIAVTERLPEDGVQVLGYTINRKVMSIHYLRGRWCASNTVTITHWMPMPNPPEV